MQRLKERREGKRSRTGGEKVEVLMQARAGMQKHDRPCQAQVALDHQRQGFSYNMTPRGVRLMGPGTAIT